MVLTRFIAAAVLLHVGAGLGAVPGRHRPDSALSAQHATQALVAEVASTSATATTTAPALVETDQPTRTTSQDKHSSKKSKRGILTPRQQMHEVEFLRKYHNNDDYAKWSSEPDHGRGPAWTKVFRMTLYQHPNKTLLDRGIGLGKAWSADDNGFISDRSHDLMKLTNREKQKLGLLPKLNRRLPPRMNHAEDPTVTVEPLPEETAKPIALPWSMVLEKVKSKQIPKTATTSAPSSIVTVDGVKLSVLSGAQSATPPNQDRSLVTVDGKTLAIVTTDAPKASSTTSAKATSGHSARDALPFIVAQSLWVANSSLSAVSKRGAVLPQLATLVEEFSSNAVGKVIIKAVSLSVRAGDFTIQESIPVVKLFSAMFRGVPIDVGDAAEVYGDWLVDQLPLYQEAMEVEGKTMMEILEGTLEEMGDEEVVAAIAEAGEAAEAAAAEAAAAEAAAAAAANAAPLVPIEGSAFIVDAVAEAALEAAGEGIGATIGGEAIGEGIAIGVGEAAAEGLGLAVGEAAAGAVVGEIAAGAAVDAAVAATEATIFAGEAAALAPLQVVPVIGQVLAGVVLFATVLTELLIHLLHHKPQHPANPGGKLHFAWDWNGIPYQYDDLHPKLEQGEPPETTPPPTGCDTFDMDDLERRGWTTTQYALAPCSTWLAKECSREWYEAWRPNLGRHDRRNPVYCFETVDFKTKEKHADEYTSAYEEWKKVADSGQSFSQYAGHELAQLEQCLGPTNNDKESMVDKKRCRKKFLPTMKHHNIENADCGSKEECAKQTAKWIYRTTGWPKGCKHNEASCWE